MMISLSLRSLAGIFFYYGEPKCTQIGLKAWNKWVFGSLDSQIEGLKKVASNVESLSDLWTLFIEEIGSILSGVIAYMRL